MRMTLTFMRLAAGEKGQLIYAMVQDYLNAYWKFNKYIGIVIHDLLPVLMAIDPTVCTTTGSQQLTDRSRRD
jgi:inosine-uridine nucleoside N-ribohydrolase